MHSDVCPYCMNWEKQQLDAKTTGYSSSCGRFHIARKGKWKLWETKADMKGVPCLIISDLPTLGAAKARAEEEEATRLAVWHYFVTQAERTKASNDRATDEDLKMCDYSRRRILEEKDKTVEELAEYKYNYAKYRAFLRHGAFGEHSDPSAKREWEAMKRGTYIQWWLRETQSVCASDHHLMDYLGMPKKEAG